MTGNSFIGLMLALMVECRHWVRLRWDFDDVACSRAWQISVILTSIAALLIWLDGTRYTALPRLLTWLPPLLLPMQLVQSFGIRDAVPLNTFSFFARQRRERNRRLGLQESVVCFNFGNLFFVATLVAATLGDNADSAVFLPGLLVLCAWLFLSFKHKRRLPLVVALLFSGIFAIAGQIGLSRLYDWLSQSGSGSAPIDWLFDPNFNRTAIGSMGRIKQSPDIIWRLRAADGNPPPRLLRTASYNQYRGTSWENVVAEDADEFENDFQDLDTLELVIGEAFYLLKPEADASAISPDLPRFNLRGAATANTPLPLPGDAASLRGFDLDGVDRNSLGTVRVFPKKSVISGEVLWAGGTNPEIPANLTRDLKIPVREDEVISQVAEQLGLTEIPDLKGKLDALRLHFTEDFQYTRYLSMLRPLVRSVETTEIGRFLTDTRKGHCEYFATSAVLLLREAGIPARYAVGFAVMEKDHKRGEHVIRGVHGHAWCRVWDESQAAWVDFDPTPPDWFGQETRSGTSMQWFHDGLKRFREDFFIWRNQPGNRLAVGIIMGLIGVLLIAYIARRLWSSRRRIADEARKQGIQHRTPLHELEKEAGRLLPQRSDGETYATWLAGLRGKIADSAPLEEAISLHQQLRFDPAPQSDSLRQRLSTLAEDLRKCMRGLKG